MRRQEHEGNVKSIFNFGVRVCHNSKQFAKGILWDLKAVCWEQYLLKMIYCSIYFSSYYY